MLYPLPLTLPRYGVPTVYLFSNDERNIVKIGRTRHLADRAYCYSQMTCLAYWEIEQEKRAERAMIDHFKACFLPAYTAKNSMPPEWFYAGELEAYEHFVARVYAVRDQPLELTNPLTLYEKRRIQRQEKAARA